MTTNNNKLLKIETCTSAELAEIGKLVMLDKPKNIIDFFTSLHKYCIKSSLGINKISLLTGINAETIRKAMKNYSTPNSRTMNKICTVFELDRTTIFNICNLHEKKSQTNKVNKTNKTNKVNRTSSITNKIAKQVAEIIRIKMIQLGYNNAEFCNKLGISLSTLKNFYNGKHILSEDIFKNMCNILDIHCDINQKHELFYTYFDEFCKRASKNDIRSMCNLVNIKTNSIYCWKNRTVFPVTNTYINVLYYIGLPLRKIRNSFFGSIDNPTKNKKNGSYTIYDAKDILISASSKPSIDFDHIDVPTTTENEILPVANETPVKSVKIIKEVNNSANSVTNVNVNIEDAAKLSEKSVFLTNIVEQKINQLLENKNLYEQLLMRVRINNVIENALDMIKNS